MKNSFAPARIDCRIRSGSAAVATAKIAGGRRGRAQPLDGGHRRRGVAADVDDDEVGRSAVADGVDNAHRDGAGTHEAADVLLERVVRRDNQTSDMGHVTSPISRVESPAQTSLRGAAVPVEHFGADRMHACR